MSVNPFFPPGHYHSPIVDPAQVASHLERAQAIGPADLKGINISTGVLLDWWAAARAALASTNLPDQQISSRRYYEAGAPYPYGDAMILRAMICVFKPKRIVEIGSGFSTACMLDSLDEYNLTKSGVVCIEPDPNRLLKLMRREDHGRVQIIKSDAQSVPLTLFRDLEKNDLLFIDSTHVLKTGSDVHYELLEVLPTLANGVIIHFHDCPFPFEYPKEWILDKNYSWNEAYALRAFLIFNEQFRILFWNSLFRRIYAEHWFGDVPQSRGKNPGSSIWLQRVAGGRDRRNGDEST